MPRLKKNPHRSTRDSDIRVALLTELREVHGISGDDLILEEFRCNAARIDVAVVNGSLHGFEIKSDSDSTYRLESQLHSYEGVFDFITFVAGRKLFDAVKSIVPKTCGLILADFRNDEIVLLPKRKARKNLSQRPYELAKMMWRDEALQCLRAHGHRCSNSRHSAEQIWQAAANSLDIGVLAEEARLSIKRRGGSGFAKPRKQDGDLCTIGSTALLDHYSENLAWLLSVRSDDRPH